MPYVVTPLDPAQGAWTVQSTVAFVEPVEAYGARRRALVGFAVVPDQGVDVVAPFDYDLPTSDAKLWVSAGQGYCPEEPRRWHPVRWVSTMPMASIRA